MATFQDLFSAQQLNAIKAVANSKTNAEQYAPSLLDFQRDDLYKFAAEHNVVLGVGFWKQMETLAHTRENVVVCIQGKSATVEHCERNTIFARHLGVLLKQGVAMFFVNISKEITWDNWKAVYNNVASSATKCATSNYDLEMSEDEYRRIKTARRKEQEFYDLARPIRSKKTGRCRISFEEANAQRIKTEKLVLECRIESRARRIFEAL